MKKKLQSKLRISNLSLSPQNKFINMMIFII